MTTRILPRAAAFAASAAFALAAPPPAGAGVVRVEPAPRAPASATLEGCQTAASQRERAATFAGEMSAVPGSARMQMRIEVLERGAEESFFHAVAYPGLGAWLRAVPGVRNFKNLDRVTDLSAPADYRAAIRFRWLNARGRAIRSLELRTPVCRQTAPAGGEIAAARGGA